MKKSILILLLMMFAIWGFADSKISGKMPITKGILPNGITYYIVESKKPEGKVNYYLLQNVGAICEDDKQQGLAHFLEHMAFKGTKTFPKRAIHNMMEQKGFPRNTNAFTSTDHTMYWMHSIPSDDLVLNDQCLLILKEWCNDLALEDEQINSERPVIVEEIRERNTVSMRSINATTKVVLNNSLHSKRSVGGSLDVIKNFDKKDLVRFYNDWYRTDLQCVIVIGDVKTKQVEEKIKTLFSQIPAVDNPKKRINVKVEDNKEVLYGNFVDPDVRDAQLNINFRFAKPNLLDYKQRFNFFNDQVMLNMLFIQRVESMQKENKDVLIDANISVSELSRLYKHVECSVKPKNGKDKEAVSLMAGLIRSAIKDGFSADEYEMVKNVLLSVAKKDKNAYQNMRSQDFIELVKNNYLKAKDILDSNEEYKLIKDYFKVNDVNHINEFVKKVFSKNKSYMYYNSLKRTSLTLDELESAYNNAKLVSFEYKPSVEEKKFKEEQAKKRKIEEIDLLPKSLSGCGIKSIEDHKIEKATKIVLENGATIIYQKAHDRKGNFTIVAKSKGGAYVYEGLELINAMAFNDFNIYGVKGIRHDEMKRFWNKYNMGYRVSLSGESETVEGGCTTKNADKFFELIYDVFQNPSLYTENLNIQKEKAQHWLDTKEESWGRKMKEDLGRILRKDYYFAMNQNTLDNISVEVLEKVYRDRFSNASDFTFYIVGDISLKKVKELSQKYIGSIPSNDRKEEIKKIENGYPTGYKCIVKNYKMDHPIAGNQLLFRLKGDFTDEDKLAYQYISGHLQSKLNKYLRQELSGTYGVRIIPSGIRGAENEFRFTIFFSCDPAKVVDLNKKIKLHLQKVIMKGITEEEYEALRLDTKEIKDDDDKHGHSTKEIIGDLRLYEELGKMPVSISDFKKMVESIELKFINEKFKEYFKKADILDFVYRPM